MYSTYNSELKPTYPRNERVHTTKPVKSEHHEVKPEVKPVNRVGAKREEAKGEHEVSKVENSKVGGKTPVGTSKAAPSPHLNKGTSLSI